MRNGLFAATIATALLSACGGPQSSQGNNSAANMSASASPPATASASSVQLPTTPVDKATAAQLVKQREHAMGQMGKAMKTLHRALDSSPADINIVRAQTATMASIAPKIPGLFPPGSGPDAGKTRAKPDIWTKHADFLSKSRDYLAAVQAIDAAAKSGDMNKVMALHDNVDKACKACHDAFRAPEH